ncbi:MAG: DUF6057 family protein [Paludibacteraceae bacterium]|nr:DUF6057 family protein [Paludibacteraceae bacterium]
MKNKKVTSAKPVQEKKEISPKKFILSEQQTIWGCRILFFLFSLCFLGIYNSELMYKLQNANFFLQNEIFFENTMQQSAGLLIYVSAYLTQLLYYPILGALVLSLILSAIELGVSHIYKISSEKFLLSFIPSGLVLLMISSIGYAVYYMFNTSIVFSSTLGVLLILSILFLHKVLSSKKTGSAISLAIAAIAFFAIGSYALVAILIITINELKKEEKTKFIYAGIGIILIALLPYISSTLLVETYNYAILAPITDFHYQNLFILITATLLLLTVYSFFFGKKKSEIKSISNHLMYNAIGMAVVCLGIFYFSFRDDNFQTEIKMQRLCEQHDWNNILKEAEKVSEPTKAISAYRIIALANKKVLANEMFRYPCILKKSVSQYLTNQPIYYEDLFLYASFPNNAYLWAMEFWVTTGPTYEHLKKMALCALLSDEDELAKKYITLLKETMFQSSWAKEHEKYIGHPELMISKYPEMDKVRKCLPKQDVIISVQNLPQTYISYSKMDAGTIEHRILADLYSKDLKLFMNDILIAQSLYKNRLPLCMKEALVICAINGHPEGLKHFRIERPFAQSIVNLFQSLKTYSSKEAAAKALKETYGNSYSYYYIFSNANTMH